MIQENFYSHNPRLGLTRAATRREVLAESPPWPETGGEARAPGRCQVCPRTHGFLQHEISSHNYPTISLSSESHPIGDIFELVLIEYVVF